MGLILPKKWVSAFNRKAGKNKKDNKNIREIEDDNNRPPSIFEGKCVYTTNIVEDIIDADKPLYDSIEHSLKPTPLWHSKYSNVPKPTNTWWNNLILGDANFPVAIYPYLYKVNDEGFKICYPQLMATSDFVISPFVDNWTMRVSKKKLTKRLNSFDDLGVVYDMFNEETYMQTYLMRGSPYLTMNLKNANLEFATIHAILAMVQINNRLSITFNNGQTWAFYTEKPIAWKNTLNSVYCEEKYNGVLRMALVPGRVDQNILTLDQFSSTYPIGGSINYEFPSPSTCYIHFNYKKVGSMPLLMLCLPHHKDCLVNSNNIDLNGYRCIKGQLTPIVADQWTLFEKLNTIQWNSPNNINPNLYSKLLIALEKDVDIEIDSKVDDPYFFGKSLAKIARLALVAEQLGRQDLVQKVISKVKRYGEPWLNHTNKDPLKYDKTWGGLVSINGVLNSEADFGNGYYNDHHFHYGYFVYAFAIIGKYDARWLDTYKKKIYTLVRDFANPNKNDAYFPAFRNKDFFDGHSWASGLFEFGDGKNLESTSESVNAYYGMYLLGLSFRDNNLTNTANMLLTTEIRSCSKYYHMLSTDNPPCFEQPFSNNKTVGMLWNMKVDYATWFGKNAEFIHCIQMLPFTPISHALCTKEWITEAYPILEQALYRSEKIAGGWKTYVLMAKAIISAQADQDFHNSEMVMDDGNTLTNTIYWLATQKY